MARFEAGIGALWTPVLSMLVQAFTRQEMLLRTIQMLPRDSAPEIVSVSPHARNALKQGAALSGNPASFLVSGHTHRSEVVPLVLDHGTPIYLNTGTWRRVRSWVGDDPVDGAPRFAEWQEECLISIFSLAEQRQGLPAFEVRNLLRGA
jgi:UDP-2,3-diacylglucosamine pyrophosphatase LpxH